jgi:hypothetical protein
MLKNSTITTKNQPQLTSSDKDEITSLVKQILNLQAEVCKNSPQLDIISAIADSNYKQQYLVTLRDELRELEGFAAKYQAQVFSEIMKQPIVINKKVKFIEDFIKILESGKEHSQLAAMAKEWVNNGTMEGKQFRTAKGIIDGYVLFSSIRTDRN